MWVLAETERVMINLDTAKKIGVYPCRKNGVTKFCIETDTVILAEYDSRDDAEDDLFSLWDAIGRKDKSFKF